jgi:hypothetical protein
MARRTLDYFLSHGGVSWVLPRISLPCFYSVSKKRKKLSAWRLARRVGTWSVSQFGDWSLKYVLFSRFRLFPNADTDFLPLHRLSPHRGKRGNMKTARYHVRPRASCLSQTARDRTRDYDQVKPRAVVVFSAHWQAAKDKISVNTAESTELIYEYVPTYLFPLHLASGR